MLPAVPVGSNFFAAFAYAREIGVNSLICQLMDIIINTLYSLVC